MNSQTLRAWVLALAGTSAVLALHPLQEADAFWHLSLGRAVLSDGARVVPEISAYPAFGGEAIAPEWLWDVATYGLYELGGYPLLNALVVVLASCLAPLAVLLLRRARPDAAAACVIAVSGLTVALAHARLRLRPQSAFLLLLPVFVLLSEAFDRAEPRRRRLLAAALIGLEVVWAQLHASFVVGPAIFALLAAPSWVRKWRAQRRAPLLDLGVLGALVAACATSAYGLGVVAAIRAHAAGDAVHFVLDMAPFSWTASTPSQDPFLAAYLTLWALGLLGLAVERRPHWGHVGCALLGLALTLVKVRFMAAGGLLLAPLAVDGAAALGALRPSWVRAPWPAVAVAALFLIGVGVERHRAVGPLGRLGLDEGKFPVASARYLETLPPGSKVLTDYWAGAPIGFWLGGRVRTFVDGRTPLHFDDTDYALAREIWTSQEAFALAERRYDFRAISVDRNSPTCLLAAERWVPVVVEPSYTTFVRPGAAEGLAAIAPCDTLYLSEDLCHEQGRTLRREIEGLRALGESPFLDYLEARRLYHCEDDPEAAAAALPGEWDSWSFRRPRDLLLARIELRRGDVEAALGLLGDRVRSGDSGALAVVSPLITTQQMPLELARSLLWDFASAQREQTAPGVRALLAAVCVRLEDAECARFHAMRAALRGSAAAQQSLAWLRDHHPAERVRADARSWLDALAARKGRGGEHLAAD